MAAMLGLGAETSAQWTESVIYTAAAGTQENVVSVALAPSSDVTPVLGEAFYVVFEVHDPASQTATLLLQKWDGSAFWTAPVELASISSPGGFLYNPSMVTRPGHVTITAHYPHQPLGCGNSVVGLKEYDYNTVNDSLDATRSIDSACAAVGHNHLAWSPGEATYHVCWTRKEGGMVGDEVYCARRVDTALTWGLPEPISNGSASNQDHATIAIKRAGRPTRRIAYHDATNGGMNGHEALLRMYSSATNYLTYLLPAGVAPQPGWQDRPFIALDGADRMHAVWEDGPTGSEVIQYIRCRNATPTGCDMPVNWQFNGTISAAAAVRARFPHLLITAARTWVSYEQELANGINDVAVLHRCLGAPIVDPWTLEDPYPANILDESTEEYGTPHIAARSTGTAALFPTEVGTVTRRQNPATGLAEGILYVRAEPSCP